MHAFTPLPSLLGGLLIGASACLLLLFNGRLAGISGILGGVLIHQPGEVGWRAWFVVGLVAGGVATAVLAPGAFGEAMDTPWGLVAAAGFLVGLGTRLGSGCTSGHGVCGMARLSRRSIAATITFMAAAALTVFLVRHGGAR